MARSGWEDSECQVRLATGHRILTVVASPSRSQLAAFADRTLPCLTARGRPLPCAVIRLIAHLMQALRVCRNVQGSDGLAPEPPAGRRRPGLITMCQPTGFRCGVARKRRERSQIHN
jgi:hypothetical protein